MTISTTTRKAGPYAGNGVAVSFAFGFKVFQKSDLRVVLTSADDIESTLVLDSDYSVTLNGNQDVSPGGSVSYPLVGSPMVAGNRLTLVSDVPDLQQTDITNGSGFYPSVIEDALDNSVILIQQNTELLNRALIVPVSTPNDVSTALPFPAANNVIGWNPDANALQNFDPNLYASVVAYGTARRDLFAGNGVKTVFALSANPATQANLDVDIAGSTKAGGIDFTWSSGLNVTFSTPPADGAIVQIRYLQGLPQGSVDVNAVVGLSDADASDKVGFIQAEAGALEETVQDKLRQVLAEADFEAAVSFEAAVDGGTKPAIYANGRFLSYAAKSASNTYGTFDNACVVSIQANQGRRPKAQVLGFINDSDVSVYSDRDSVGLFVDNIAPAPTITATAGTATYTSTSITAPSINPALVKAGMIVDTAVDPATTVKWSGVVTGAVGTTVTVSAWYQVNGTMTTGTPPNTLAAYVNPTTKAWATNFNILFKPTSHATDGTGLEIGVVNDKGGQLGVGFDSVSLGSFAGGVGYRARGFTSGFAVGYQAQGCRISYAADSSLGGDIGFYSSSGMTGTTGFISQGETIGYEAVGVVPGGSSFRVSNSNRTAILADVNANGQHGAFATAIKTTAVNTTIDTLDYSVVLTGSTAGQALTPVSAAGIGGRTYEVINKSSQTWTITGVTTVAAGITVIIKSDNTSWVIVSRVANT